MILRRTWVRAALCAAVGVPVAALAGPGEPGAAPSAPAASGPSEDIKAQAAALYKEGAGLFKAGRFKDAAERFQAAYNLDPSPILLYNLARAAEEQGKAATAVGHYKAYLVRYPQAEDRAEVERRIRVLEAVSKTVPPGTLSLAGVPAGATVTLNGAAPPAAAPDGKLSLAPGAYLVRILPIEGEPRELNVEVKSGAVATVDFNTEASPPAGSEAPAGRPMRLWGWVGAGVGAALLGVGAYFYLDSFSAADDFEASGKKVDALDPKSPTYLDDLASYDKKSQDALDRMDSDLLVGRVLLSVGGLAAAAGATLLVLDATGEGQGGAAFVPYPGGAGLVIGF